MKTVQNTIIAILLLAAQSLAEETCLIGNDKAIFTEFQEGDVVELDFSLCGESSCICDPTLETQLACSFCYDAPTGDCYKHGDVVSKDGKTCTCESASVNLVCEPDPGTSTTQVTESPTKNPTPTPTSSGNPLSRQSWIVSFGLLTVAGLLVL